MTFVIISILCFLHRYVYIRAVIASQNTSFKKAATKKHGYAEKMLTL